MENLVGYARRNYLAPVMSFRSWKALNDYLLEQCQQRLLQKAAGSEKTIGQLLEEESAYFLPLPKQEFEACRREPRRVSSLSLVKFKGNNYSVPVSCAYRDVLVKEFPFHLKKQLARKDLVIVDEFGYVPFSKTGAELLFELFSERYEQGSIFMTTNLPFEQWTEVLGSQRLTGALLDRLTHRVAPIGNERRKLPFQGKPAPQGQETLAAKGRRRSLMSRKSRKTRSAYGLTHFAGLSTDSKTKKKAKNKKRKNILDRLP